MRAFLGMIAVSERTAEIGDRGNIWASLPGAGYGQHENTIDKLAHAYQQNGGVIGMKLEPVLWLMCFCGLLLHFFTKYSTAQSDSKIGVVEYLRGEWAKWVVSALASIACMGMLPSLPAVLGLPEGSGTGLMRVLAFLAGYTGSSIVVFVTSKAMSKMQQPKLEQ